MFILKILKITFGLLTIVVGILLPILAVFILIIEKEQAFLSNLMKLGALLILSFVFIDFGIKWLKGGTYDDDFSGVYFERLTLTEWGLLLVSGAPVLIAGLIIERVGVKGVFLEGLAIGVLVLCIVIYKVGGSLLRKYGILTYDNTENRLNTLLLLSEDTVKNKKIVTANIEIDVERCIKSMQTIRTYSGRTIFADLTTKDLIINSQWRIDFSAPNAIHVSQKILDTEQDWLHDEWITINEDHYQNSGLWTHKNRSDTDKSFLNTNKLLKVNNLLSILKKEKPIKSVECSYKGVPYIQLIYSLDKINPHILEYGFDLDCNYIPVHVWINQETHTLAKGNYILSGTLDGNTVKGCIQQVYTNYGDSFEVTPPPWVNAKMNENGEGEIINTKVPIVRHYE